jgi:hypothetical protein
MTATSTAVRGRRLAESIMVDTCTITRPGSDSGTFDPDTGETVPSARTTVYTGKCRSRSREVLSRVAEMGGQAVTTSAYVVSIPVTTTGVEVGDMVTVTASNDPGAVRNLIVQSVESATYVTARRLLCSDNQG